MIRRWWFWLFLTVAAVVAIAYRVNVCVGGDRPWWC